MLLSYSKQNTKSRMRNTKLQNRCRQLKGGKTFWSEKTLRMELFMDEGMTRVDRLGISGNTVK